MAAQLQQGIPTPIDMRLPDDTRGHEALAIAVEGSGDSQRFLVHDPSTGETAWLTRKDFEWGTSAFSDPEWNHYGLAAIALAREQLPPLDEAR